MTFAPGDLVFSGVANMPYAMPDPYGRQANSSPIGDTGPWMICATVTTLNSNAVPVTWHLILTTRMFIGWVPEGSLVRERWSARVS